jgi:excinuclease ABC subunit B
MTVGRTEKPVQGKIPPKPLNPSSPSQGEGEERSAQQTKRSSESFRATNARSESEGPAGKPREAKPEQTGTLGENNDPRPLARGKVGAGSYEDESEARRQKRRPGKTGRPGR